MLFKRDRASLRQEKRGTWRTGRLKARNGLRIDPAIRAMAETVVNDSIQTISESNVIIAESGKLLREARERLAKRLECEEAKWESINSSQMKK